MGQKASKKDEATAWRDQLPGNLPVAARYVGVYDISTVNTICVKMVLRSDENVELVILFDGEETFKSEDYGRWSSSLSEKGIAVTVTRTCAIEPPDFEEIRVLTKPIAVFHADKKTGFLSSKTNNPDAPLMCSLILQRECDKCGGFGVHFPPFPDVEACKCGEEWKVRNMWGRREIIVEGA